MRILFCVHVPMQTRHFLSLFRCIREQGHELTVIAAQWKAKREDEIPSCLVEFDNLTMVPWPRRASRFWDVYSEPFRMARNARFFLSGAYRDASALRDRADGGVDPALRWTQRDGDPGLRAERLLERIERAIPPRDDIVSVMKAAAPDVVLVSPLVSHLTAAQTDFVKAAHVLGLPVGLPVFSWDNMTTKGFIHVPVDHLFVWNDVQRREAVELHGVSPEDVSMHGAWRFDDFVQLRPSVERAVFCERFGLDADRPIILYLGSSPLIAPDEGRFALRWLRAIRSNADPAVAEANILIRPHPRNARAWADAVDVEKLPRVAFQDPASLSFLDDQDLFDILHHSRVAVGVNTSAMLEAAMLGKPVHTVIDPDVAVGQKGVLHFEYLVSAGGGLLYQANDLDEHTRLIAESLRAPAEAADPRADSFRKAFLASPAGDQRCSTGLLDGIERLAAVKKRPVKRGMSDVTLGWGLRLLIGTGLLPIRPAILPEINATPDGLGGRGVAFSLTKPSTFGIFKPLWPLLFRHTRSRLSGVLSGRHRLTGQDIAVFDAIRQRVFLDRHPPLVISRLERMAEKRLAAEKGGEAWLSWLDRPAVFALRTAGGQKYIVEGLCPQLGAIRINSEAYKSGKRKSVASRFFVGFRASRFSEVRSRFSGALSRAIEIMRDKVHPTHGPKDGVRGKKSKAKNGVKAKKKTIEVAN